MRQYQKSLTITTSPKNFHRLTAPIEAIVAESGITTGLCSIFVCHTSASLLIQENADPDVLTDLANFFAKLVQEDSSLYYHSTEGPDDMPAHIRSVLTRTSEQIPIARGKLVLGIWQGIYLWEHRQSRHQRQVVVHITGV
ncbi:MAG: YjbQ family protein [Microcystis viridis Mv_BB_P_19951000_S69]|jgi:secondary thiamine-phosphate synthase enzyme|uniref:YjbQ family protein n=1 Tax=Microcystis viridis Mv_BB_P_19951000_S68D TaxID=2486270 RepID=A0A552I9B3_MICVR|nr:secondary thiamine-phosphate synthase enzyme YjbQ [Microcystis aeruginosa]TRU68517.1 MAG: YjbQ family protein [Microcystis viridis Mv_BB_P_19951000_S68]TRU68764.1 MAG: YjbQ family protein [Microcystis viridis Mv_BB_P_19951000_S69]TRU80046.1 MAG: YjbQ family protein [Microcystis viridis Mv_BB_P_19951000_S68D]TRU83506.1 MAG: YjbQ family protein [Microcystis viridis Mv_BB_P_19951000_S69D]MDB9419255.1 secondary thiamine-phosphate synthase enzyme YjbQ [Microcystis aeruginosa CS-563/04]